jgi:hypothetical protein
MTQYIYIDESKKDTYVVAAATQPAADIDKLRKMLRAELVLRGQTRIHMVKESDPRRRKIADAICRYAPGTVAIYEARKRHADKLAARHDCLQGVIDDIPSGVETVLVLDQDDSILHWDKEFLYQAVRRAGLVDTVRYGHQRARTELLLSVPDAIAWCWARGGPWRKRIMPAVRTTKQI